MSYLLRLLGVAGVAGLLAVAAMSFETITSTPTVQRPALAVVDPTFAPLPSTNTQTTTQLLARSPFVPDRTAFDRSAALNPPSPPATVRLSGISRVGKEFRATLVINGQAVSVKKGDETPVGIVSDIEATAVVIGGPTPQRIEMFKQ